MAYDDTPSFPEGCGEPIPLPQRVDCPVLGETSNAVSAWWTVEGGLFFYDSELPGLAGLVTLYPEQAEALYRALKARYEGT